jgi:hypothetical protein
MRNDGAVPQAFGGPIQAVQQSMKRTCHPLAAFEVVADRP